MRRAAWLVILWLCLPRAASAEDQRPPSVAAVTPGQGQQPSPTFTTKRISLFDEYGFAGPYGWAGFGAAARIMPWWSVEVGGGLNLGGFQPGVGSSVHLPLPKGEMFGILLAMSWDTYVEHALIFEPYDFRQKWNTIWGYVGLHARKRFLGPAFMRGTVGGTAPLSHSTYSCEVSDGLQRGTNLAACMNNKFNGTLSLFVGVGLEFELF